MVTKIDLLQLFLWFLIKAMNSKNVLHLNPKKPGGGGGAKVPAVVLARWPEDCLSVLSVSC